MKSNGFIRTALLAMAVVITAGLSMPVWAQPANVTTGQAVYHDTSPRLDHLPPINPGKGGENRQIPNRQAVKAARFPDLTEPDGGLQSQASEVSQLGPTPGPIVSAPGLSEDDNARVAGGRIVPPDINGDIGLDESGNRIYIQYINLIWGVFNVNGILIAGPFKGNSFWQGFGGYCQTNNDGDPVVLYDDQAGRWVFSQFSISEGIQCMAVSTTSDPLGAYYRYAFTVSPGKQNDYPKLGVWPVGGGQSSYTFTTRDFPDSSSGFMGTGVMERDQMLVGGSARFIKFSNPCTTVDCIEGQLPPHLAGPAPPAGTCPTFWTAVDSATDYSPHASDGFRNNRLCVNWSNLNNSTYSEGPLVVAGSNFDRNLGNINPVYGGEQLNSLPYFTMYRAQYRWFGSYGSVVLNTTVDAGSERAGIRWAEVRSANDGTGWFLQQDGTFAPDDSLERWMGSIAQDQDGNIALGYTVAGSSLFPSVRYTSRMAGDAAGTMPGGEVSCVEGTGAQAANSYNRWGDYSSMSVDPTDDCTFWYTQEYYETTGSFDFNTRICSFRVAGCSGPVFNNPPQVTITEPANGSEFEVGASVTFSATANDFEDGDLSGYIQWFVDDSYVAVGNTFYLDTSGLAEGSHEISARVTDFDSPDPKNDSDLILVTIVAAPVSVHVDSVVTGTLSGSRGQKYGTATVTIFNDLGKPASGYTVTGNFGGSFEESASGGLTSSNGQVTLRTAGTLKGPTVTFCVSSVTGDLSYAWDESTSGTTCGGNPPTSIDSFTASPNPIVSGETTTLSWSVSNATSCTASGAWFDAKNASGGSESVAPVGTGDFIYVLDCSGAGAPDSASVTVMVNPPASISVSGTGSKSRGDVTVELTWSGATSDSVDIKRNGVFVATVTNPTEGGSYTDNTKGGSPMVYEVCEAGTTICGSTSVSF